MAAGLAFAVIALGAFTRLMDAGLGCPDWPGCYGHFIVNQSIHAAHFVAYKAWAEMVHRYFAAALGTLILLIIVFIYVKKELRVRSNIVLSLFLIAMLVYQIILGQWTVTFRLSPLVVTQHLLGGFLILSFLWLIYLNNVPISKTQWVKSVRLLAYIALILLFLQIALGAWVSTQYASLSCPDFPFCDNHHALPMQWHEAFQLTLPQGVNYEGGRLTLAGKQTIQMTHRLGAFVLSCYLLMFMFYLLAKPDRHRNMLPVILLMMGLLISQLCIGMVNVLFKLPLFTAVLHNLIASLLLVTVITLIYKGRGYER